MSAPNPFEPEVVPSPFAFPHRRPRRGVVWQATHFQYLAYPENQIPKDEREYLLSCLKSSKRKDTWAVRTMEVNNGQNLAAVIDALYGLARLRAEFTGFGISPVVPFSMPVLHSFVQQKWPISVRTIRRALRRLDELGIVCYLPGEGPRHSLVGLPRLARDYPTAARKALDHDFDKMPQWWRPDILMRLRPSQTFIPDVMLNEDDKDLYDANLDFWDDHEAEVAETYAEILLQASHALAAQRKQEQPRPDNAPRPAPSPEEELAAQQQFLQWARDSEDEAKAAEVLARIEELKTAAKTPKQESIFFNPTGDKVDTLATHTPLRVSPSEKKDLLYREPTLADLAATGSESGLAASVFEKIETQLIKGGGSKTPAETKRLEAVKERHNNKERAALIAALPKKASQLTASAFKDGQWVIKEEASKVLTSGNWATVAHAYRRLDPKTNDYGPIRFAVRRYFKRKHDAPYVYKTGFSAPSLGHLHEITRAFNDVLAAPVPPPAEGAALAAAKTMAGPAKTPVALTRDYRADGPWLAVQNTPTVVVSEKKWATTVHRYQERDPKTGAYRAPKYAIHRSRKNANGNYCFKLGFVVSSTRQLALLTDLFRQWAEDFSTTAKSDDRKQERWEVL